MLNDLYGDENQPIDEKMLKDYGGEIIDEQEDVGSNMLGR